MFFPKILRGAQFFFLVEFSVPFPPIVGLFMEKMPFPPIPIDLGGVTAGPLHILSRPPTLVVTIE